MEKKKVTDFFLQLFKLTIKVASNISKMIFNKCSKSTRKQNKKKKENKIIRVLGVRRLVSLVFCWNENLTRFTLIVAIWPKDQFILIWTLSSFCF